MIVVGSGPAGIACAQALLARGHDVTLIDVGLDLPHEQNEKLKKLAVRSPTDWTHGETDFITRTTHSSVEGIPIKTAYGSNFMYAGTEKDIPMRKERVAGGPSFAVGGLSRVWGAAVLPFRQHDIVDWPISVDALKPHYEEILKQMPLAGERDDLETWFPLYTEHPQPLRTSTQAAAWFANASVYRRDMQIEGIRFGKSRLSVHAEGNNDQKGCQYCRLCLHGCPYRCIYSTKEALESMRLKHKNLHYRSNWVVKQVNEDATKAAVTLQEYGTRRRETLSAEKVFLAAGVYSTTKILLESLKIYNRSIMMASSQHFMFPLWSNQSVDSANHEALHTLAQAFIDIEHADISNFTVHLQLYTHNDLIGKAMDRTGLGLLLHLTPTWREHLISRLLPIQGYLHSRESPSISVALKPGKNGEESELKLCAIPNITTQRRVHSLLKLLRKHRAKLGGVPITSLLRYSQAGGGYHSGGTFPMQQTPGEFQSDVLGRPAGFKRIHAVDATVLPSIPATTITLSVMANAHRIGSTHA